MIAIELGKTYDHVKVVGKAGKNKYNRVLYRVICDCGREALLTDQSFERSHEVRCPTCSKKYAQSKQNEALRRKNLALLGHTINGWTILAEEKRANGALAYRCQCARCGNISVKSMGEIHYSRSERCGKCRPEYHFVIDGPVAIGQLGDGTQFKIDTDDIGKVQRFFWRISVKDQYVTAYKPKHMTLHRFLLGVVDHSQIVDHINHDRTDCRKSNLRIVTPAENSFNHSSFVTNKTGFTGVYFDTNQKYYAAKVGYRSKRIYLGSSKDDAVLLAQMYNIAAQYLYGEYVGELNRVPDPSPELVRWVIGKLQKYKQSPCLQAAV